MKFMQQMTLARRLALIIVSVLLGSSSSPY